MIKVEAVAQHRSTLLWDCRVKMEPVTLRNRRLEMLLRRRHKTWNWKRKRPMISTIEMNNWWYRMSWKREQGWVHLLSCNSVMRMTSRQEIRRKTRPEPLTSNPCYPAWKLMTKYRSSCTQNKRRRTPWILSSIVKTANRWIKVPTIHGSNTWYHLKEAIR